MNDLTTINNDKKQPEKSWLEKFLDCKCIKKILNPPPFVAVVKLSGVIANSGMMRAGLSIDSVESQLNSAFGYSKAKAVALVINSPGGSPVQSELIYKRIRDLSLEKNIPVISFTEDVAASGGYWLACAGDEIFTSENSIIGSIGVISASFGFSDAIKKLGIERRIYTQGKNKSVLDPFSEEKPEDIEILKSIQADIHESFKNLVRTRRLGKLKADEDKLFNGEFWTGKKAVELGLVDNIGDIYSVIKEKFGKDVVFKKVSKNKMWFWQKFSIQEILAESLLCIYTKAKESALWQKFGL